MKNNASLVYNFCLLIGDYLALVLAFVIAYILRVSLSSRVISQQISALAYFRTILPLLLFFLLIFALLGMYTNRIHEKRFQEFGNLLVGSFVGILFIISYGYVVNTPIFPARLVTLYALLLAFFFVFLFRTFARGIRRELFRYGLGINNVLIVGDTKLAHTLISSLANTAVTGYHVRALVAAKLQPGRPSRSYAHYPGFAAAVAEQKNIHTIIQTELYADGDKNDEIVTYAQEHHIGYRFVPGNSELFTGNIDAEVFHSVPVIAVHQTALVGWGRVVKRAFDIIAGSIAVILTSPIMLLVVIVLYLTDGGDPLFKQRRLSRYGNPVFIYKFRTQLKAYHRMSPEEGFAKMGRPELATQFRANGDFLDNDPRISRLGRILRKFSFDELPQLLNVVKGDISLVGPRPLEPFELEKYSKKNLILSVRTGVTGLAIVSGRRDISFEERRALDLYYVQNWTFWGDIVILIKTVWIVLNHRGAR